MRSLLQCPCLSTDRALINQGNHKEIWGRLCRKSHWDHKRTASKCVCPQYLSLSASRYLSITFFCCSSFSPSTSFQTPPCRQRFCHYLNCTSADLRCHFKCWFDDRDNFLMKFDNREITHRKKSRMQSKLSTATCRTCHLSDSSFHFDTVVGATLGLQSKHTAGSPLENLIKLTQNPIKLK